MISKKVKFQVKSDQSMRNIAAMSLLAVSLLLVLNVQAFAASDPAPPLKQLRMGVDPHDIECMAGQVLVFRANDWLPACVSPQTHSILLERQWASDHDPSHGDLKSMVDKQMAKYPQKEVDMDKIVIEEEMVVDADTGFNGTAAPEPRNHVIELREDMEMGAN